MSESNSDGEDKQRKIILLEERNDPAIVTLSSVLKSPLGLAAKIATQCFQKENGLLSYKNDLDVLKRLGVGLESAMHKESYPIANYSSYLFAFPQFIHSSYRARQGNFAEGLIRAILQETRRSNVHP